MSETLDTQVTRAQPNPEELTNWPCPPLPPPHTFSSAETESMWTAPIHQRMETPNKAGSDFLITMDFHPPLCQCPIVSALQSSNRTHFDCGPGVILARHFIE